MTIDEQTPLIWTKDGNLPLEELDYEPRWEITDEYIKFVEVHRRKGTSEVVREAAHVLARNGFDMTAVQEEIH